MASVASSQTGQAAVQGAFPTQSIVSIDAVDIPDTLLGTKKELSGGWTVLKVNKHGKLQARRLCITPDRRHVLITSQKMMMMRNMTMFAKAGGGDDHCKSVALLAVDRIQRGLHTHRFTLLASADLPPKAKGLSIIHYAQRGLETIDLVVPDAQDYAKLTAMLETLHGLVQQERSHQLPNVQHVRFWWARGGKLTTEALTLHEWLPLCAELGIPLPKHVLSNMYKEDLAAHYTPGVTGLTVPQVVQLLDDVREACSSKENNVVEALWSELVETDPVPLTSVHDHHDGDEDAASLEMTIPDDVKEESISSVAFLSFLRSHQKMYATTLEEATELLTQLASLQSARDLARGGKKKKQGTASRTSSPKNTATTLVDEHNVPRSGGSEGASTDDDGGSTAPRRLKKSRFMAYLLSDVNDLLDPKLGQVGAHDMKRPLSAYWIASSHDTYLASWHDTVQSLPLFPRKKNNAVLPEYVNDQNYLAALLRGVRCLEVDVWDGPNQQPVVARFLPKTGHADLDKLIPLNRVLRTIRYFLQENPYCFPVILKLENHCSPSVQLKMAKLLYDILGAAQLIYEPTANVQDKIQLPSPEAARGKLLIMGKRPKIVSSGCQVMNDDLDDENDNWDCVVQDPQQHASFDQEEAVVDAATGTDAFVIGFDANGAIKTSDPKAYVRSPAEILERLEREASAAQSEAAQAKIRAIQLQQQAESKETDARYLADRAGMSTAEVRLRAARAANRAGGTVAVEDFLEEKNPKEEGIEVHDVLRDYVATGGDRYAQLAQEAMEAEYRLQTAKTRMTKADEALLMAQRDLERSKSRVGNVVEEAQHAAREARLQREYADDAKQRVVKVRSLLLDVQDKTSSAGTVVQTALTEAQISEKRAVDAEARAERAKAQADKDRAKAENESHKEEDLENEVTELHQKYLDATNAAKAARERVEKAANMLDQVNAEIKSIESSSQYRKETNDESSYSAAWNSRDGLTGGSMIKKHAAKLEEREVCRELIKEASEENQKAEVDRSKAQHEAEEMTHLWRIQADLAGQLRKVADRSSHVAEELAEHAEEEREAANLRHTARQKAELTVENGDSHRDSLKTQLAEAERASAEANNLAVQSRKRADRLSKQAEQARDQSELIKVVEQKQWESSQAKGEYDAAQLTKERCDQAMVDEKARVAASEDVYKTTVRDTKAPSKITIEPLYEQEAIVAYNLTLLLHQQAKEAALESGNARRTAQEKSMAANHARDYKERADQILEIPTTLAKVTFFHTRKHRSWTRSMALTNVHVHSFPNHVLTEMIVSQPDEQRPALRSFTRGHLCRAFPHWEALKSKGMANYDPVFAWSLGVQLVGINLHAVDEKALVADGRFRENGSCGYVLKPDYLMTKAKAPQPQTWTFRVLSATNLPQLPGKKPLAAPFVKMSLYTGEIDKTSPTAYKTPVVKGNRLNPVWEKGNSAEFVVDNPSIAVLSITVWNGMDDATADFVAGASIPASCLREGFRSVALFDAGNSRAGQHGFAALMVQAAKR